MTSTSDVDENDRLTIHSPHYFIKWNLSYRPSRSDAAKIIKRAHDAVRYIASLDKDHAKLANGAGFSKSDVRGGHNLARIPVEKVVAHPILSAYALKLARKYKRQLPLSLLVDQPEQMSMKV